MMRKMKSLLLAGAGLLLSMSVSAHDIEVDAVYYRILSEDAVSVTYRGTDPNDYSGEYSGVVIIPNSVTYADNQYRVVGIEGYACSGCSGVTSVEMPNSVISIGYRAFSDCSDLVSVEIPNSVINIWTEAFSGCSGVTSVEIPNSVTSIEYGAFSGWSGLISIVVDDENTDYDSREGCNAIIEKSSNTLIVGCQSTILPNNVTSIGDGAFSG